MKPIYHIHVTQEHLDAGQPVIRESAEYRGADEHQRQNHQPRHP